MMVTDFPSANSYEYLEKQSRMFRLQFKATITHYRPTWNLSTFATNAMNLCIIRNEERPSLSQILETTVVENRTILWCSSRLVTAYMNMFNIAWKKFRECSLRLLHARPRQLTAGEISPSNVLRIEMQRRSLAAHERKRMNTSRPPSFDGFIKVRLKVDEQWYAAIKSVAYIYQPKRLRRSATDVERQEKNCH
jgi:hypothetical protein